MKKMFLSLFCICALTFNVNAQSDSVQMSLQDSIAVLNTDLLNELVTNQKREEKANRYKIYPTENIYILIMLDCQTGKIDLIQWSLKSKDEFSVTLNNEDLSGYKGLNSFELYPTKNMYQFILLDKATGRNWHVQWGTKSSEMWIRRIY